MNTSHSKLSSSKLSSSKLSSSKLSRVASFCILLGLTLRCALFAVPEAKAAGYEECNQILTQDIFNRVIKSDSTSSSAAAAASAAFFEQNETQAYEAYEKKFKEAQKKGTKIDAEFHYGIIGGELGIAINSEKMMEKSEFASKFAKAKTARGGSSSSSSSSSQNLASTYASYVRDPGTVNAWKDCVTRTRETNLYAFASRDPAGQTFVNVMWVPGALAGSIPSILISFVTAGDAHGVKIHAKVQEQVAVGSGRTFAVTCGAKCDNGFQITVNGALTNAAGSATSSFTSTVDVPPLKPPMPVPTKAQELMDVLAANGEVIANMDPLAVELRKREQAASSQRGFNIGMAAAEGHTSKGPGKQKIHDQLSPAEQVGFSKAVDFSLERNTYFELAAKGAALAKRDPELAKIRTENPSVFFWLGFDIATGIFGGPSGNTLMGPGSLKIRNSLSNDGRKGFDASVKLHLGPPPRPRQP